LIPKSNIFKSNHFVVSPVPDQKSNTAISFGLHNSCKYISALLINNSYSAKFQPSTALNFSILAHELAHFSVLYANFKGQIHFSKYKLITDNSASENIFFIINFLFNITLQLIQFIQRFHWCKIIHIYLFQ
jgi:hypothetical protein